MAAIAPACSSAAAGSILRRPRRDCADTPHRAPSTRAPARPRRRARRPRCDRPPRAGGGARSAPRASGRCRRARAPPQSRPSASASSRARRRRCPDTTCRSRGTRGRARAAPRAPLLRRRPFLHHSYDPLMPEAVIVDAVRTPIGRYGGVLASVRPDDLAARVVEAVVERTGLPQAEVDDVILGCTNAAGEDNRNVARMALLIAGLPIEIPGVTVNRLCASGLEAVAQAARGVRCGDADLILAGGVESMSRSPFVMLKPERSHPRGDMTLVDTTIGWRFVNPRLGDRYSTESMGETAENVAARYEVPREDQDAFALESHRRAVAATESGRFDEEIVTVDAPQ